MLRHQIAKDSDNKRSCRKAHAYEWESIASLRTLREAAKRLQNDKYVFACVGMLPMSGALRFAITHPCILEEVVDRRTLGH